MTEPPTRARIIRKRLVRTRETQRGVHGPCRMTFRISVSSIAFAFPIPRRLRKKGLSQQAAISLRGCCFLPTPKASSRGFQTTTQFSGGARIRALCSFRTRSMSRKQCASFFGVEGLNSRWMRSFTPCFASVHGPPGRAKTEPGSPTKWKRRTLSFTPWGTHTPSKRGTKTASWEACTVCRSAASSSESRCFRTGPTLPRQPLSALPDAFASSTSISLTARFTRII